MDNLVEKACHALIGAGFNRLRVFLAYHLPYYDLLFPMAYVANSGVPSANHPPETVDLYHCAGNTPNSDTRPT